MVQRIAVAAVAFALVLLTASANAFAARCNTAVTRGIPGLGAETAVTPGAETVAAGQTFAIHWQRGPFAKRYPAYLMIAFDHPVRFEGKGFYALLPGATAAFGIKAFADRTRAVIPYYGQGVPRDGDVVVRPLQAGPLHVAWAVVGHDGCREVDTDKGSGAADIRVEATGLPEIVVKDFAGGDPKERIYSPAGGRVIEVYDGRYRIVDEESSAEVAERPGTLPRFSPTGRYVAAYVEDGIEFIDAIDGKTTYKSPTGFNLAWDDADSFAILDRGAWGAISIIAPSLANPVVLEGNGGCHACGGTDSTAVRVDLENNVAVYSGGLDGGAASLTVDADSGDGDVVAFVRKQSQVTAFALPKVWELHGGLKFSHIGRGPPDPKNVLARFLVKPLTEPVAARQTVAANAAEPVRWRGLATDDPARAARNMLVRLKDFGLPIPAAAIDPAGARFKSDLMVLSQDSEGVYEPDELAKVDATASRLEAEVPFAHAAFGEPEYGDMCVGAYDKSTQRYVTVLRKFQRAFRFESGKRIIWLTHLQCREGSAAVAYPSVVIFDKATSSPWILGPEVGNDIAIGSSEGYCTGSVIDCAFDAQVTDNGRLVLSSAKTRAIEILDLKTRKTVFKKYDLPRGDLLKRVLVSPDGKLVLQINSDDSFVGFRMADAAELFQGRYVDDEVVVWTPDGRFDATSEGAHYVSLRLPGRVGTYTFEQFSAQLKTPGLVGRLLAGETFPPAHLVSPPSLAGTLQATSGRIHGTVEAAGDTPLASLIVLQDGLLTDRIAMDGASAKANVDVALLPGTRWVSFVALDQHGLASVPMGRDLPAGGDKRRVHVLAVGVDKYSDPDIPDLKLAGHDATRFAEAIGTIRHDVAVASERILGDKDATRAGVLAALKRTIAETAKGETVVLFFAGHGIRDDDGTYYLATSDTNLDDMAGSALAWNDIAAVLADKPQRIAVFLDTCHSGAAGTGAFATNDSATKSLLERIPSGIVVFSASKGRELSEESKSFGGGIFTSALLDVIARKRDAYDRNRDGAIEISELYRGVKGEVSGRTGGRQTPWIARNQMVGDFALF